ELDLAHTANTADACVADGFGRQPCHLVRAPDGTAREPPVAVHEHADSGHHVLAIQDAADAGCAVVTYARVREAHVCVRRAGRTRCLDGALCESPNARVLDRRYRLGAATEVRE